MKNKRWFPIFYMFVVTACFSAVIIGFAQMTEEQVKANQAGSFEVAVLKVLPGLYDPKAGAVELHRRFVEQVSKPTDETAGAYTSVHNGKITGYALPFSGQGFWAAIDGVIGDFDVEGLLEGHHQLDDIERVRAEVVEDARILGHLGALDTELLGDDRLNPIGQVVCH